MESENVDSQEKIDNRQFTFEELRDIIPLGMVKLIRLLNCKNIVTAVTVPAQVGTYTQYFDPKQREFIVSPSVALEALKIGGFQLVEGRTKLRRP
jgi:hypothetical protein